MPELLFPAYAFNVLPDDEKRSQAQNEKLLRRLENVKMAKKKDSAVGTNVVCSSECFSITRNGWAGNPDIFDIAYLPDLGSEHMKAELSLYLSEIRELHNLLSKFLECVK